MFQSVSEHSVFVFVHCRCQYVVATEVLLQCFKAREQFFLILSINACKDGSAQ